MPDATRTKNLKVFSTWYPTDYQLPWLMTDHVYHMSALNQNVGYNMPTQAGYYIGSDMEYVAPEPEGEYIEIEIGATGYATFGNNTGKHLTPASGLTAYSAKPGTGQVVLTQLNGVPQATGVILKGTPNTVYRLYHAAEGVTYSVSGNYLQRVTANGGETLAQQPDATHWNYVLGDDNGTAKFYLVQDDTTIAKGKAYLKSNKQLHGTAAAHGIDIVFSDDAADIKELKNSKIEELKSCYNLAGQRVAEANKKGLYIVNGRKVIVR